MTDEQLKEFMAENRDDIQQAVKARLIEKLLETHRWSISDSITTIVREFVDAEIAPAVRAHLQAEKGPLIEAAIKGASEVGDQIAKAMVLHAAKNIQEDSYRFRQVMEVIFK